VAFRGRAGHRVVRVVLGFALAALSGVAFAAGFQDTRPAVEVHALIQRAAAASPEERAAIVAEIRELAGVLAVDAESRPEDALGASKAFEFLSGEALRDPGDPESALALAQRALELAAHAPPGDRDFQLAQSARQVAGLQWQLGRFEAAVASLRNVLPSDVRQPLSRAYVLATLADFERLRADWEESERHALEAFRYLEGFSLDARAIQQATPEQRGTITLLLSLKRAVAGVLARVQLDLGLFDAASEWALRHEELAALAGDEASRLDAVLLRSTLLFYGGRLERAGSELQAALKGGTLRDPYSRLRVGLLLCEALVEQAGVSDAQAESRATEARTLLAEILEQPGLSNADRLEAHLAQARLALASDDHETAREPLEAAEKLARGAGTEMDRGNRSLPFVTALCARRARTAAGAVPEDAALRTELEQAFEDLLMQWSKVPQRPGGVGLMRFENKRAVLSELLTWTLGNEPEPDEPKIDRCLRLIARAQAYGSLSTRLGASEVGLAELRSEVLGARDGLLVLVPDSDRTHAFLVGRGFAIHRFLSVSHSALVDDADKLSNSVSDLDAAQRNSTDWKSSAGRLASNLFPAELRAKLEGLDGLAVVGADLIGDPALEALPLPDGGTLGTRWALSSLPSLPVGVALARRVAQHAAPADLDLWLLAANGPSTKPKLPPIPFDEAARERLLAPFGDTRRMVIEGSSATRAKLADTGFGHAVVGCFVTHGLQEPGRDRSAGLQLAPDAEVEGDGGELWCDEIDSPAARGGCPRLVVLATCSAARGARRMGDDGLGHLGGAFLARGAQAVVLARHEVELAATLRLLEVLNERLAAGDTVQEALRRARVALRDDPRTAHPFYSGAFHLVGLGQRAVLGAPPLEAERDD
jgi:hypothetical protein